MLSPLEFLACAAVGTASGLTSVTHAKSLQTPCPKIYLNNHAMVISPGSGRNG
jgi:hypothetical protein